MGEGNLCLGMRMTFFSFLSSCNTMGDTLKEAYVVFNLQIQVSYTTFKLEDVLEAWSFSRSYHQSLVLIGSACIFLGVG